MRRMCSTAKRLGGCSKERSTDQLSWGPYVEPEKSEKERIALKKPEGKKGNPDDLHAFWEEDESEDDIGR